MGDAYKHERVSNKTRASGRRHHTCSSGKKPAHLGVITQLDGLVAILEKVEALSHHLRKLGTIELVNHQYTPPLLRRALLRRREQLAILQLEPVGSGLGS